MAVAAVFDLSSDLGLSAGDPGEFPPLEREPSCCGDWCVCALQPVSTELVAPVQPVEPVAWAVPGVPLLPGGPTPGRVSPLLTDLAGALDAVHEHGPLSGGRADTALLLTLTERARGLALRELAEMDTVGGHLVAGEHPTTTASWLRDERQLTDGGARSAVRLATQLRDVLPGLSGLLMSGATTLEHAAAVVGGVRGLDPAVVTAASDGLCALAQVADPVSVRRRLRDMASAIDDRLAAEVERRTRERAGLRVSQVGDATAIDGTLAGEDGATVRLAMALAVEAARSDGDDRGRHARQGDVLVQ